MKIWLLFSKTDVTPLWISCILVIFWMNIFIDSGTSLHTHMHVVWLRTNLFKDWCISISVLKTGIITKAKGSAHIEQGQTKASCAVYGPREIPRRSDFSMRGILNCTLEHTPYAKERRKAPGSQKDDLEAEMSNAIGQALEATVCMVSFFDTKIKVCNLRRYFQFDSFSKHQSKSLSINFLI